MILAAILFVLSLAIAAIGIPVIEGVGALLFVTTTIQFLLTPITRFSAGSSYFVLCLLLLVAYFIQRARGLDVPRRPSSESWFYLQVLVIGFVAVLCFCLLWPDFIAIGERLRDYALLGSVIQHPGDAVEPWMSGVSLNYYLFWYRLGALLAALGHLQIWDTYHQLQSFTFALFVAALIRLFHGHLGFSKWFAVFCSVIIAFGSNCSGVWHFLYKDHNWWGPSRVIPGAINEFPAWSFLLGDLHPHFLNLALIPFFLVVALSLAPILLATFGHRLWAGAPILLVLYCAWVYNANAWELPVALLILVCVVAIGLLFRKRILKMPAVPAWSTFSVFALFLLTLLICGSLYFSSRNIQPLGTQLRFVVLPLEPLGLSRMIDSISKAVGLPVSPTYPATAEAAPAVYGTRVVDLLKHWGMPLTIIASSTVLLLGSVWVRILAGALLVLLALSGNALLLLVGVLGVVSYRLYRQFRSDETVSLPQVAMEGIGIALLFAIIFPELVFFDDPYGGENERMNTIFKFYSASWGLFHAYAFYLGALVVRRLKVEIRNPYFYYAGQALFAVLFLGFFFQTIEDREQKDFRILPREQGLTTVDNNHRGGGIAVQKLEQMARGVVLETQGGAYNYTSFVSTLSGNVAYLGWANHVNLLTNNSPEVPRREKITQEFYSNKDCQAKLAVLRAEGIAYVVFGTLERRAYPEAREEDFGCLRPVIREGEYVIYTQ